MSARRSLLVVVSVIVLAVGSVAEASGPLGFGSTPVLAAEAASVRVEAIITRDDGEEVNGTFDIQFRLYDSESEGDKVGRTATSSEVPIADGLLVAAPDFGPRALGGQARWLEVSIKPSTDGGPFKTLTPRLPVAQTEEGAFASGDLLYQEAERRDDDGARRNVAFWALSGNSDIDPGDNFLGTTDAQPLIIRTNNNEVIRITPDGRVGIGTDDPAATLHVVGTLAVGEGTVTVSDDAIRIPVTFPGLLAAGEVVIGDLGAAVPGGTDLGSGMGIFVSGGFGFPAIPLWVVTEKGSVHNVPETFFITDASGQGQRGAVTIGPGGVVVKDNSGNVVFQVNENGVVVGGDTGGDGDDSLHVPLIGGGTLFTDDAGLAIVDNQGRVVFRASETGVFTDSVTIPLDNGAIFADNRGISIADENGTIVWQVNSEKSVHRIPEEFSDLRVVDNEGNIVWQVTPEQSVHFIPELFQLTDGAGNPIGALGIGPGGLTVTDNTGTIAFKVDQNGIVIGGAGGGPFSIPLAGGGTLAGDASGISVRDANGNVLWQVDSQRSVHNIPEEFRSINIMDSDGNVVATWSDALLLVSDKDGSNAAVIAPGALGTLVQDEAGNMVGEASINSSGFELTDNDGKVLWRVGPEGSLHNISEAYSLTDESGNDIGALVIGMGGITVLDNNDNIVFQVTEKGVVVGGGSPFPITLAGGGTLTADASGIAIKDGSGNVLWQVNTEKSLHKVPEEYALFDSQGNSTGKVVIDSVGIAISDAGNNLVSLFNQNGSIHNKNEEWRIRDDSGNIMGRLVLGPDGLTVTDGGGNVVFHLNEKGVVTGKGCSPFGANLGFFGAISCIEDSQGNIIGAAGLTSEGFQVVDANDNLVWQVNTQKSIHNIPEEFTDIRVVDAAGNVVWQVTPEESVHNIPEEFTDIRVVDDDGNVVWHVTPEKSVHNIPEEYVLSDDEGNRTGTLVIGEDGSVVFKNATGETTSVWNEASFRTVLRDAGGNEIGRAFLDDQGLALVDSLGLPLWSVTSEKSVHNIPEEYRLVDEIGNDFGTLTIGGERGILLKDSDGKPVGEWNSFQFATVLYDDEGNKVGGAIQDAEGFSVFTNERGVVWSVTPEKSQHQIPEEFALIDDDGSFKGTFTVGENGKIFLTDASGKVVSVWDESGQGTVVYDASGNAIAIAELTGQGFQLSDNQGNILWQVTTEKSVHNIPEEYRLTDAAGNSVGTLTIGQGGLTVKNNAGTTVFQVNENGVVVGGGGGGGTASALSATLPGGETLTVDSNGINLMAGANLLYQLTPQGSVHRVPEVFTSIKVETDPNSTAPKTTIDISPTTGITMFDEQTGAVSGVNPSGQFFSSTADGSYFAHPSTGVNVTSCDTTGCNSFSASPGVSGVQQVTNGGNTFAGIGTDGSFSSCDRSTGTDTCLSWSWNGVGHSMNDVPTWGIDQAGNFTTPGDVAAQNVTADSMTAGSTNSLIMESFPVLTGFSYTPGTVLVIDASTGKLKPSTSAADPAVIGVVAPGATVDAHGEILVVILGARGPMRMDGTRVEVIVNVDTSLTGPIVPGDPLVTAPAQGRAMKRPSASTDPAAIFAKALQPVAGGQQATIRAFISHW